MDLIDPIEIEKRSMEIIEEKIGITDSMLFIFYGKGTSG